MNLLIFLNNHGNY